MGLCTNGPAVLIETPGVDAVMETNVDSLEKIVDILQNRMNVSVNQTSVEVLRLNCEFFVFYIY